MIKGLLTLLVIFLVLVSLLIWAKSRPADAASDVIYSRHWQTPKSQKTGA